MSNIFLFMHVALRDQKLLHRVRYYNRQFN